MKDSQQLKVQEQPPAREGSQRLSIARLKTWESLGFGMFLHFGMSTFDGLELSPGTTPIDHYQPHELDVDQWLSIARDVGMRYAVLTVKHVSGFCLWPSRFTDYHVGNSPVAMDVVEAFIEGCQKRGLMAGLYYCSWDNRHRFGSLTPGDLSDHPDDETMKHAWVSKAYMEFQHNQLDELLRAYGPVGEVWIDIPGVLPRFYRQALYNHIACLQPEAVIMMNNGLGLTNQLKVWHTWPSDLLSVERALPLDSGGNSRWRTVEGKDYYVPVEVCEPAGQAWFHEPDDQPRSDMELLGLYCLIRARGGNLLLNVGPDKRGLIPSRFRKSLFRLRRSLDKLDLG